LDQFLGSRSKAIRGSDDFEQMSHGHSQGSPTCPRHLSREAKVEWRRITRELKHLGLLTKIDRAALAIYVRAGRDGLKRKNTSSKARVQSRKADKKDWSRVHGFGSQQRRWKTFAGSALNSV
jgi:phage terminase small subunit